MKTVSRAVALSSAFAAVLFAGGCGDSYGGRMAVNGEVKLKGQHLKEGTIYFAPADGQSTQSNVMITDGKYKIERKVGLVPGRYVIRISAADKKTTVDEAEAGGPGGSANVTFFDIIPPEWNVASKQEVTVEAGKENVFNFDIPNVAVPRKGGR